MKKAFVYFFVIVLGMMGTTLVVNAEDFSKQIQNQVQKSMQKRELERLLSFPEDAKMSVKAMWTLHNTARQPLGSNIAIPTESILNTAYCSAVLCNYTEKQNVGIASIAFGKECFSQIQKEKADAPVFRFHVNLGQFGYYFEGEMEGEPFFFETEVDQEKDIKRLFHSVTTASGKELYLFNMPVRTELLKQAFKDFFDKNEPVSNDLAAAVLKYMPQPQYEVIL